MNDGSGHFSRAAGEYPSSEIHLCYDSNEDGKIDLTMTYQGGGDSGGGIDRSHGDFSSSQRALHAAPTQLAVKGLYWLIRLYVGGDTTFDIRTSFLPTTFEEIRLTDVLP